MRRLRYWHPGAVPRTWTSQPATRAEGRRRGAPRVALPGGRNDNRQGGDDDDNHTQADDNDLRADRDGRNSTTELAFAGHHEEGGNRQV